MSSYYKLILSILLLISVLLPFSSYGQSKSVFSSADTVVYTFGFNAKGGDQYISNLIVRDIAFGEQKGFSEINIIYSTILKYNILDYSIGSYTVNGEFVAGRVQNAIYKGFNLSDVLKPAHASLNLTVRGPFDDVIREIFIDDVSLISDESDFSRSFQTGWLNPEELKFDISGIEFSYDNPAYENFKDRVLLINNYYAALSFIDIFLENLNDNYFGSSTSLIENYFQYLELQRLIRHIESYCFLNRLDLQSNDPGDFIIKTDYLRRQGIRYTTLLKKQIAETPVYCRNNNSLNFYLDRFYGGWDWYYELMYEADHDYRLFYEKLIRYNLDIGLLGKEYSHLNSLYKLCSVSNAAITANNAFISGLLLKFRAEAINSLENDDHTKALNILYNAKSICDILPGFLFPESMEMLIDSAESGIKHAYIEIGQKALLANNLQMAEQYLDKSMSFSERKTDDYLNEENSNELLDTVAKCYYELGIQSCMDKRYDEGLEYFQSTRNILEKYSKEINGIRPDSVSNVARNCLYNDYIHRASSAIDSRHYSVAEEYLIRADELADQYPDNILYYESTGEMYQQIYQYKYTEAFDAGIYFMSSIDYEAAAYKFLVALFWEKSYDLEPISEIDSLLKVTGRSFIYDMISEIGESIEYDDLDYTLKLMSDIRNEQKRYGLQHDEFINKRMIELSELLQLKTCKDVRSEFDGLIIHADDLRNNGEYHKADENLDEALKVIADNENCTMDNEEVLRRKKQLQPLIYYKEQLDAIDALAISDFDSYVNSYNELEQYFGKRKLGASGARFEIISVYSLKFDFTELHLNLLSMFISKQDWRNALIILQKLFTLKVNENQLRAEQELIGKNIAGIDYPEYKDRDPHYLINDYTKNFNWFRYFREAYLQRWLELKSAGE